MKKALVAYFSASGVTKRAAGELAKAADAELYEIKPQVSYTREDLNWRNPQSRSSMEMKDKSIRPALADRDADISSYDVIFLGFPIWWYVAPTIINTFLEAYDFSGKTIILFATSGGSGFGNTVKELKESCPGATLLEGKLLNGVQSAADLRKWLETLSL